MSKRSGVVIKPSSLTPLPDPVKNVFQYAKNKQTKDPNFKSDKIFIANLNGKLAGFVRVSLYKGGEAEINQITVKDELQKRRIGSALLGKAIAFAKASKASTIKLSSSQEAISFYDKHTPFVRNETYGSKEFLLRTTELVQGKRRIIKPKKQTKIIKRRMP